MANKVRIVIFFIGLVFAVWFGYQLFGPNGSIGEYQAAVEEQKIAEQNLAEAEKDLEEAKQNLTEALKNSEESNYSYS